MVNARDELVPDQVDVQLMYADQFQLFSAGTSVSQQWRLNSFFDPDYTNSGAQPSGFDEWKAFYGFYKVYKVIFECTISPSSFPVSVVMYYSPNVTIASGYSASMAQPHAVSKTMTFYESKKFNFTIDIAKNLGVDPSEFADVVYGADVGSNPTRVLYLTLVGTNVSNGSGVTIYISFKMRMYGIFQQRTYVGLSRLIKENKEESDSKQSTDLISSNQLVPPSTIPLKKLSRKDIELLGFFIVD